MTSYEFIRLLGLIILLSSIAIYIIWGIKTGYFRLMRKRWIEAGIQPQVQVCGKFKSKYHFDKSA
jgi:hypothetical protein